MVAEDVHRRWEGREILTLVVSIFNLQMVFRADLWSLKHDDL